MLYRILITALIPPESKEKIPDYFELDCFLEKRPMKYQELFNKVKHNDYDAMLCAYEDKIDESLLQVVGKRLKIIAVMSNGIENIDLKACQNYGIKVTNVPGVTTDAIADYTLALLLMGIRRIDQSLQQSHHQITPYYLWNLQGFALSQLTIGIVGMGQIGSAIAQRLVGFEPRILYYSRKRKIKVEHQYLLKYTSFEQLLAESDAVIVCCSLNHSSKNMFKLQTFKQMKSSAIFINIARGGICNHQDLYTALKEGLISLALLDVTEPEPLPKTHPLVQINNCLIFPHIATNTQDSRIKICNIAIKEICQVLK